MFQRVKYAGDWFLPPELIVRCVCSELPNEGTIMVASGCRSYWSGQNHHSLDKIHRTDLFIPPPVDWFHRWVDTILRIIEFLCWSIRHMFPDRRQLHEEHNAFNRIEVKGKCVIIIVKVDGISQAIIKHFARLPRVEAHRIGHFMQSFEDSVGRSEVPDGCHCKVCESALTAAVLKMCLPHQWANR